MIRRPHFVLLIAALLLAGCGTDDGEGAQEDVSGSDAASEAEDSAPETSDGSDADTTQRVVQGDFEIEWRVEGEDLHVVLRHPTTGWLAVGFDPSRMMKDANMILGYVADGEVVISDEFGTGNTSHRPDEDIDGTDDILYAEGSEGADGTELRFAIPLNSNDAADRPLEPGGSYTVLLAFGPDGADDFTTFHRGRYVIEITI